MEKILLGYISGTHGLRGDLIVKSKFEKQDKAFKVGNKIYLNDELHEVTDAKIYKDRYLIKIDNMKNINLVEHYKAYDVYIDREELHLSLDEYLFSDLIDMKVVCNNKDYGNEKVEFSHCFGKLTSGIDFCGIDDEPFDYNIHYLLDIKSLKLYLVHILDIILILLHHNYQIQM